MIVSLKPARGLGIPAWAVLLAACWLGLVAALQFARPPGSEATLCVFRNVTGLPCPTCGSTRVVLAAARGDFLGAWLCNPAVATGMVLGLAWLLLRLGFGRTMTLNLNAPHRRAAWITAAAIVLANWVYVIARHLQ